jgi:hypothetical protein
MKMYQAFANVAHTLNQAHTLGSTLDFQIQRLDSLIKRAPSGAGFNAGTELLVDRSSTERLVFNTPYQHMDDAGGYDGWTEHEVWVKADLLVGFTIRVTGPNRNNIKEFIADAFYYFLNEDEIPE